MQPVIAKIFNTEADNPVLQDAASQLDRGFLKEPPMGSGGEQVVVKNRPVQGVKRT